MSDGSGIKFDPERWSESLRIITRIAKKMAGMMSLTNEEDELVSRICETMCKKVEAGHFIYKSNQSFGKYVKGLAYFHCKHIIRDRKRGSFVKQYDITDFIQIAAETYEFDEEISRADIINVKEYLVMALIPFCKDDLDRHIACGRINDRPYAEIATELEITEACATTRFFRIVERAKKILQRKEGEK
jgi:DNA-directed RNA polymerase specialized sigma24 family protein